jgi:hypothetical protein
MLVWHKENTKELKEKLNIAFTISLIFQKNSALIYLICVLFYVHFYCGGMNAHIEDGC